MEEDNKQIVLNASPGGADDSRPLLNASNINTSSKIEQSNTEIENEFYGKDKDGHKSAPSGLLEVPVKTEDSDAIPVAPMSPSQKILYYAGSPGRFVQK